MKLLFRTFLFCVSLSMNKVNATIITLGIFATALVSCKKDANSKVDCEIKVASTPSFDSSNEHKFRLNAAGQTVSVVRGDETYIYKYKANQVTSSLNGRKNSTIVLENGRAVKMTLSGQDYLQKNAYDTQGRLSRLTIETSIGVGNIYTYNYIGGNLDHVLEELPMQNNPEHRYSFEYTDLRIDNTTRWFALLYGSSLINFIPVTLLGTGSVNLPSKITYTIAGDSVFTQEFTYTTAADGKVNSVNIKHTLSQKYEGNVHNEIVEITSSCN